MFYDFRWKRIQETNSWWIGSKLNKYWKLEKKSRSKGWILEESWRKSMDDVNSWRSWWVSMVLGRSWRKEARRKSFGHLEEFPDFGRLDLLSLIGLYRNVEGRIGRSGLHETCRWLKILEFNIRLAQKKSPNTLSKLRRICWSELKLELEIVFAVQ